MSWFTENWSIGGTLKNVQSLLEGITGWKAWLVAPILIVLNFIVGMMDFVLALFSVLLLKIDELIASSINMPGWDSGSIASDVWAYGNAFVPLDLSIELIGLYFALLSICAIVRIAKSFIPMIS